MRVYRTIHYGLGPIGQELARLAVERESIEVVGAVDIDPAKVGKDLGEVIGLGRELGVTVRSDVESLFDEVEADAVLHTTGSYLERVFPQLEGIIRGGLNVVSTCEELSFPAAQHPDLAERLDALAREHGVTVLGTGVNPGFVMDALPLAFSAVAQKVTGVRVERIQNASTRRQPLQAKIGSGKTVEEFRQLVEAGTVRHVGLQESVYLVAAGLGWTLDDYRESTEPVVADHTITTSYFTVQPGLVCGVDQVGRGFVKGEEVITLHLRMYLDADPAYDKVVLEGPTRLELVIPGGLQGDRATTAIALNAVPRVVEHAPGLVTMKDLPYVIAGR
ncbi:MAG: dihydrodipicolinate reductase [Thermomicrobiaceae bacterium]|nr:dihydrodipicolinate reductase [Thermomicrobiaceae bacterium]